MGEGNVRFGDIHMFVSFELQNVQNGSKFGSEIYVKSYLFAGKNLIIVPFGGRMPLYM